MTATIKALMVRKQNIQQQAFTVVELVIIIAVIGILATVTIFGFGSWRTRTAETEVNTALKSLSSSLDNERTFNSEYPASIPDSFHPSSGVTTTYSSTSTSYCASGKSVAVPSVMLYITNTRNTASKTPCS